MGSRTPLHRVLFVCRGSVQDGMGHVTRSRAVALEMSRCAEVKMVVVGDPYINNLLVGRDLDYQIVAHDEGILQTFNAFEPQVVFLDMLALDETDLAAISSSAMTVSLSPIFNCQGRVDVVFSRARLSGMDQPARGPGPLLRCGLEYAVVSDHCVRIPEETYASTLNGSSLAVAISMGGTDASNKALRVLESVKQVPNSMIFWVLLGEGYAHSYQALIDCMSDARRHEIILAKTNNSMWRILGSCSFAILGSGTTTFEAAFAGLPSINMVEDPSQEFLVRELVEHGACLSASYPLGNALGLINEALARLDEHRSELLAMHQRSRPLIDGRGVQRIIAETQAHYEPWSTATRLRSA